MTQPLTLLVRALALLLFTEIMLLSLLPLHGSTTITATKSGNDITFTWTPAGGQTYDGTRATNAAFFSAVTMFRGVNVGNYTYAGGLTNSRTFEVFDITDQTEANSGTVNNGGFFPSVPPTVTNPPMGTIYIGQLGAVLNGTDFSTAAPDNGIWFPGGILAIAKTVNGTGTQLTFDVPPGALSGNLSVSRQNAMSSDPVKPDVYLDNPAAPVASAWTLINTISFSSQTGDYWISGRVNGVNDFYREYYDATTTKTWVREGRRGAFTELWLCATQTDRFGRVYCAVNTPSTTSVPTRFAQTNPAANLQNCRGLSGLPFSTTGDSVVGLAAAADPNPDAVAGRDVVYFLASNSTLARTYIIKLGVDATGCISTLDRDYGNKGGSGWSVSVTPNGLAVDRDGNVYIALLGGTITKIAPNESQVVVKTGVGNMRGIDVKQEVTGGPVTFLTTEYSTTPGNSKINWFSTDNPGPILPVRTGMSMRSVAWGATVTGPAASLTGGNNVPHIPVQLLGRNSVIANDNNSLPIHEDPRMRVGPEITSEGITWLSSPGTDADRGQFQLFVRKSTGASPSDYSTVSVNATFNDNIPRLVCARSGDPLSGSPYEAAPADPQNCGRSWLDALAVCDNQEAFNANGAGSFTDNNSFEYCPPAACGSLSQPCIAHLRVSQQYAGDNYKVSFYRAGDARRSVIGSTGVITPWKHVYLEKDSMCKSGGILYADTAIGDTFVYIRTNSDGSRYENLAQDDIIHIFDSMITHENPGHDIARIRTVTPQPAFFRVKLDLCMPANCLTDYTVGSIYLASNFQFNTGNGAGVCRDVSGNFGADTSDMPQSSNDAYLSVSATPDNAGVIPYLPQPFYSTPVFDNGANQFRFARIWFKNCSQAADARRVHCNKNNYFHLIASEKPTLNGVFGNTYHFGNSTYIHDPAIATPVENRSIVNHEVIGHESNVNACVSGKHDSRIAWCDAQDHCGLGGAATIQCLMDTNRVRTNGINRFDPDDLTRGITASCMNPDETAAEPAPVQYDPPEGAIRYETDPQ